MKTDLVQYLKDRYAERNIPGTDPGPVVTIARETGCTGKKVAQQLMDSLNKRFPAQTKIEPWKWVGKEIFVEASKELGIDPLVVRNIFEEKRGIIDEFLSSQSQKYYKNDRTVIKTISEIIRSMANHGHVIILGRGGVPLSRDIPKSLHIYLEAPIEWRINVISEKYCFSLSEARKYVEETDARRIHYREHFEGKGNDYTWVDVKYNSMQLKPAEIVESIIHLMEIKNLL